MVIKIYKTDHSTPCRATLMTFQLLGLKHESEEIRPMLKETETPEYLAKNPAHTVPFLEDGDFQLSDSHAINTYLVSKYGGEHKGTLYPAALETRATIDQRLFLDSSVIFPKVLECFLELIGPKNPERVAKWLADIKESYVILEVYLTRTEFMAADHLTLADISLVATISSMESAVPLNDHPKLDAWFRRMQQYDWYKKGNAPGAAKLSGIILGALKSMGL